MEYIFHEKQEGSLCAVHCLNSLLQGSYFTPVDLASLAQRMDDEERLRMAESGEDTDSYRRFVQEPSGNMDDSGYFSVQVISAALDVWGLDLVPYSTTGPSSAHRPQPLHMTAFICNYRDHWLTVRKLGNQWFNLNSLLSSPQLISDTYLEIFLAQLQQEGYSIFAVCGTLPHCEADERLKITPATPVKQPQPVKKDNSGPSTSVPVITVDDDDNSDLQRALRLSAGGDEDSDLKRALELSLEEGDRSDPALQHVLALSRSEMESNVEEDEDAMLSRAIELSRSVIETPSNNQSSPQTSQHSFHSALSQGSVSGGSGNSNQSLIDNEELRRRRLAYLDRQAAGGQR